VTPRDALAQAKAGRLLPVYVVTGDEQLLRDEVVAALRAATLAGGVAEFNEDKFNAGEADVDAVVSAARTVPMMAPRRFVLVRGAEQWEAGDSASSPFDRLAAYARSPVESTCMVVVAAKLDGRRKFALAARKAGYVVACEPLDSGALPAWIIERCGRAGHEIERNVAELIAALVGPQLSQISDALDRLSLYVGPDEPIDERAVGECVARIRSADTWALVEAVRSRDLSRALRTLADAYDPRDRGIMLLGALAWSIRQLARFQAALHAGASEDQAAEVSGVFQRPRAVALAESARSVKATEVERWILVLAETDLTLKRSRNSPDVVLAEMLTRLCRPETRSARRAS